MKRENNDNSVAEFFAGIGLMRAGLEQAGWQIEFANDIEPNKKKIYTNHFQDSTDHFCLNDIHQLSAEAIPTVSLATASFPCTDLSLAGPRTGLDGEQSSAFWGFMNILKGMKDRKPPLILLENVTGFLTSHEGQDFFNALSALNKLGYAVDAFIINAAHFVPQSRVRLFVVGKALNRIRRGRRNRNIEESELRPAKLVEFIANNPSIKWDLNNSLPPLPILESDLESIIEQIPKSSKDWWVQSRVDYLLNQTFERHLSKVLDLREADKYSYLTAFRRVRNKKSMAEIRFDGIAGCLRTPKGGSAKQILLEVGKGEINVRLISPTECARLMGIGDYKISGSANDALFGFGDAVCVPVVKWIAENYLNPELQNLVPQSLSLERA